MVFERLVMEDLSLGPCCDVCTYMCIYISVQAPLESVSPFIALSLLAGNSFRSMDSGSSVLPPPM